MRILHLAAPAEFGGLERVVQMLSRGQARVGHDVHVAAVLDAGGEATHPFLAMVSRGGVTVHVLEVPLRRYRLERALVKKLCQRLSPEVVHTHGYRVDVLHGMIPRRLGIPRVTTAHGFIAGGVKNRLYLALQRWSFRRADAVVAVSQPLQEILSRTGVRCCALHCVPNAWDGAAEGVSLTPSIARERLGVPEDRFHVGFVGRLGHEKGADLFMEALGLLQSLPFLASIIGAGSQKDAMEERARELRVEERIRWQGVLPAASRYLAALDVFVLSSRTEGTPIALLEAISAGVPVVATRVGGVPDVVSEREALLVEPERPDQLAAAIQEVHRHPGEARERARRARQRMEREFSADAWVARYDEVYRQAIERRRQAGR